MKLERQLVQVGFFGIFVSFSLERIFEVFFFYVRISLIFIFSVLFVWQDIFYLFLGRRVFGGRFYGRKIKYILGFRQEFGVIDFKYMDVFVDFFLLVLRKLFVVGYFFICEIRLFFQQSRIYLMNGGRGLRWKRILIVLIVRIQAFKNDLDGLIFFYLCYSK